MINLSDLPSLAFSYSYATPFFPKEFLVGMEPLIRFLFNFIPSIFSSEDARLFSKQLCSKCAQHSAVFFQIGSLKLTRCHLTNLTHFALTVGSDGKKCIEIPDVYPVLSLYSFPCSAFRPHNISLFFPVGFFLFYRHDLL